MLIVNCNVEIWQFCRGKEMHIIERRTCFYFMVVEKVYRWKCWSQPLFPDMLNNYRNTLFDTFAGAWWYLYCPCIFWVEQKRRHKTTSLDVLCICASHMVQQQWRLHFSFNNFRWQLHGYFQCLCVFHDSVQFSFMKKCHFGIVVSIYQIISS